MGKPVKKISIFHLWGLVKEKLDFVIRRKHRRKRPIDPNLRAEFVMHRNPKLPVSEAYRMLRTNIQYLGSTRKLKSIVITSSGPREGKTTTVLNIGYAFAQSKKKTLLIDSDLRNPSFHRLFNLNNDLGFVDAVIGRKRSDEVVHKDILIPNLHVMTSGTKSKNPAEVIGSKGMIDFMSAVKESYDMVIFDSPPVLAVTDAQLLSVISDGVVLVIQAGKTGRDVAKRAKEVLDNVEANIIGAILNNLDMSKAHYYYYYRHYYSYYYPKKKTILEEEPPKETEAEIKSEIAEKVAITKKKDLFIPKSSYDSIGPPHTETKDNIITLLSEEEKKEAEEEKGSIEKGSALGRKPIFFENKEKGKNAKLPNEQDKDRSGLGRKNMFEDLK